MSTQERVSVTGWWLEYVRRVVVQWVRKTTVFATLNFNILFRPTQTSTQIIKDDEAAGVVRALKYYSKMFALAFTIQLFASRFRLWEGLSEWRLLVQFGLELLIAIPIIYVLSRVLPERIPFLRVVQAALYVDGLYMVIDRIVSIPISYLYLVVRSENRELDIFGKEFERCLSNSSIFYWLLRGDLKFFLYNDMWKPANWANWFFENYSFVVMIPFVFIFALMLRPVRKISFISICLLTAIVFIAVEEGAIFAKNRLFPDCGAGHKMHVGPS